MLWPIVLANFMFSFVDTITFQSFTELPCAGRKLINLDKAQIPNLRVRIEKRKALDSCVNLYAYCLLLFVLVLVISM